MKVLRQLAKLWPFLSQTKGLSSYAGCCLASKPCHLICFKQWTAQMVMDIISSALNLKYSYSDTHCQRMDILKGCKIMILQEVNEPVLNMAVSKAATLLGAYDVSIIDNVIWDQDYNGSIFSYMADAIFVATSTHQCIQRFANQASVPVTCMRSRTHASIQALSTVMAIIKCPVTPLLYKASKDIKSETHTDVTTCKDKSAVLSKCDVVIAGPTSKDAEKIPVFTFSLQDVKQGCNPHWVFFHTCPRGAEVSDDLFYHENTRTFKCFENMQFIAAALMANGVKGHRF